MSDTIKTPEAASILGHSQRTVRNWARRGLIPARLTPGGRYVFERADVEAAARGVKVGAEQ